MNRQQPLALAPPAGDADWSERSIARRRPRAVRSCSINLAFLDLAVELAEEGRLKQIAGPAAARDRLADRPGRGHAALRPPSVSRCSTCGLLTGISGRRRSRRREACRTRRAARRGRARRRRCASRDHGGLASRADAHGRARGSFSARPRRPSLRSPRCRSPRSSGSRGASRPRCRAIRLAHAVLAAVRGLRCPARRPVREPAAAARTADPGRGERAGQALQRRHQRRAPELSRVRLLFAPHAGALHPRA